jgi:hypothetical protein
MMVAALKRRGVPVTYVTFADEFGAPAAVWRVTSNPVQSFVHHSRNEAGGGYRKSTNRTAVTDQLKGSVMYQVLNCLVTEHD